MANATILTELEARLGSDGVLVGEDETAAYVCDWRQKLRGQALAVVRPSRLEEVVAVCSWAHKHHVSLVPQGGNTGLCGAATPDTSGHQVVVSMSRMNRIRSLDPLNNILLAEAGCILTHVQTAAQEAGRLFPLSLAAEGSAQIGGLVATNAGGTAVLRYGNMRDLVLGLEVVLPQGEVWSSLAGLRKDNTGYDLKQLFIGSEGTLGLITAVALKMFPRPRRVVTAFCSLPDLSKGPSLLRLIQDRCGDSVTTFEVASDPSLQLVAKHFSDVHIPLADRAAYYALFEVSCTGLGEENFEPQVESILGEAAEAGLIQDAAVARNEAQVRSFWRLREEITESEKREGRSVKHDVSLPITRLAPFVAAVEALTTQLPNVRLNVFGHVGDGSLHVNVLLPPSLQDTPDSDVFEMVHDCVATFGGSFSAEHGVGQLKLAEMQRYKRPEELRLMRAIKEAFDPLNLMNPGKMLPTL